MALFALLGFSASVALIFLLMPSVTKLSHRIGAVAVPNERSMHTTNMPRLGGLAIFLSFMAAMALLFPFASERLKPLEGILLAALIIEIGGVLDDKYTLSPKWKLLSQLIATGVVIAFGLSIDQVHIPFGQDIYFPVWLSIPLTMFWIIGVINAVNWIDGLDGLATGVSGIALATTIIIALITGNVPVLILCSVLLGSLVGFFFFNFDPAKIFMGESGSAFLGFLLATVSILGFKQAVFVSFIIPLLILGVPLFDTFLAITRRIINRKPVYSADRGHLHHSLFDLGISRRNTVYILYGTSTFFGLCAIILTKASSSAVTTVFIMLLVALLLLAGAEIVGVVKKRKPILRFVRKLIKQSK